MRSEGAEYRVCVVIELNLSSYCCLVSRYVFGQLIVNQICYASTRILELM